jgi:hypothetical protein
MAALLGFLCAAASRAEVTATHDAIIKFNSSLFPSHLPRNSEAPVGIRIEAHVKPRSARREPPALTAVELGIHRAADLSRLGLPICDIAKIDPASSEQALQACPGAQIGYGRVRAKSTFPNAPHFHFDGRVIVFNGRLEDGSPAILLHVFSPRLRTSFVFPLTIEHRSGRYRTVLVAHLRVGRWSSVTGFQLVVDRTYSYHGKQRGFLNASCPALQGTTLGVAPFVVATLHFADGTQHRLSVVGSCEVRR